MSEIKDQAPEAKKRPAGRFFAVKRQVWENLWTIPTANRLLLVSSFLVLAAGTDREHRVTRWSSRACEQHVGIGMPRAKRAIEELLVAGVIERAPDWDGKKPTYLLPEIARDEDPIFLPVGLITGFSSETPVLRRIRESGDAMLLRLLVDLHGLVHLDATYGVPVSNLKLAAKENSAALAFEAGVHRVWSLKFGDTRFAAGEWAARHRGDSKKPETAWQPLWDRLNVLERIGAIWFEPWVFDGTADDSEPLFPVDLGATYANGQGDETTVLSNAILDAVEALAGEREYLLETDGNILVPLNAHQQAPALISVAKLRVEADTPGRRWSFARRMQLIRKYQAAYAQLALDARNGILNRPLGVVPEAA